jgi:hypothetical protein
MPITAGLLDGGQLSWAQVPRITAAARRLRVAQRAVRASSGGQRRHR